MSNCSLPGRPVLRYFGGKWRLAPWIIEHFPVHRVYVEPFGGGASVLMRKPRSHAEVYNDLDGDLVNLFRILRDERTARRLEKMIRLTPFARDEFDLDPAAAADPIERARRTLIRAQMCVGQAGLRPGQKPGFRAFTGDAGTTSARDWHTYPDLIADFVARLGGVVIENRDAKEVMAQQDTPETLHFVDPPYVADTRGSKAVYRHEMTDAQHIELCDFLVTLRGMVILCGYEHPLYDRLNWAKTKREAHADGARDRVEVLWMNSAALSAQSQVRMF